MSVGRSQTRTAGSHPSHTEVPAESAPPRPFDLAAAHPQSSPAVNAPSSRLLGQCRWGSERYLGGEQTVALFSSRDGPRKLDSVQGAGGPAAAAVKVPQGCSRRGPGGSSPTPTPTINDESPSCTTPVDLTLTDTVWQPRECPRSRAVMPGLRSAQVGLGRPRRASCRHTQTLRRSPTRS